MYIMHDGENGEAFYETKGHLCSVFLCMSSSLTSMACVCVCVDEDERKKERVMVCRDDGVETRGVEY